MRDQLGGLVGVLHPEEGGWKVYGRGVKLWTNAVVLLVHWKMSSLAIALTCAKEATRKPPSPPELESKRPPDRSGRKGGPRTAS